MSDIESARLGRAQFLGAAGAAAVGAGLAPLLAAPAPAAAATPKRGGTVTLSHPGAIGTLDPAKQNSADEDLIAFNAYETLTLWDHDGKVKPLLALSWKASQDLRTWTFKLRPNVKFHHGKPFTADDVKFSIQRLLDPKTGSNFRSYLTMVDRITVVNPLTVRFHLSIPYADLPTVLTTRAAAMVPSDKGAQLATGIFGTGPFTFKEFVQGDHVTLMRSPNYWRAGLPYLDSIVFKEIPEDATRLTTLQTGESDMFWQVPFALVASIKKFPGVKIAEAATNFWDPLIMNCKVAPFTDPRVRKAVRLCLDKDTVIKVALKGHGQKVILPLLPSSPDYPSQVKDLKQDYEQAKKLLSEAGHPDGFEVPMYIGVGRPAREAMSALVVNMLKPANIRCKVQRMPIDKFFATVEGHGALYADGFQSDASSDAHLYPVFHTGGSFDISHWDNPQADRLLDQARRAATSAQRRAIYGRFAQLQNEEGPAWIPWVQNVVVGYRSRIQNYKAWHDFRCYLGEVWVS